MTTARISALATLLLFTVLLVGCSGERKSTPEKDDKGRAEDKVKANLAMLDEADRPLAEKQKYCAVDQDNLLGSMGKPVKLTLKGKPVFLCCKGCKDQAEADPDKTLAAVEKLKAKGGK